MTLIGISGRKRSGKDTFAARLTGVHGYTRVAFADPLRAMALALDPLVRTTSGHTVRLAELAAFEGWERAKNHAEVRRTLQRLGTEAGRAVLGDTIWIDTAMQHVDQVNGPVVITDVRYPNEADAIRAAGGIVLRIDRPGLTSSDVHPSETAMDDYPHFTARIVNDRSIAALQRTADRFV